MSIGFGLAGLLCLTSTPMLGQAGGPGDDPPITLHLADADPAGLQSEAEAAFFAQRVNDLSGGDMTVEVTMGAAVDLDQPMGPEAVVAQLVEAGDYELGMTNTRAWDLIGVTSLQVLQTPFLIDDTALAAAVATSDIATRALDGMSVAGLKGLALWPEHLRYLFAFGPQGKAFLTPEDVAGTTLVDAFSGSGRRYLTDMGATIWAGSDADADAAADKLQGGEFGFFNGPANYASYATGNLVFYPRTKLLFANASTYASLSDRRRSILEQAAIETRDHALGRVVDEAALAVDHCGMDGHVAFASDDAVAAFHEAAQPTIDTLRQDPLTAQLIDEITALKASITPGPKAQPCDPPAGTALYEVHDPEGYQATLPPAGSYRVDQTVEHQVANGVETRWAAGNSGVNTFTFDGDTVTLNAMNPSGPHHCVAAATLTADGRAFHLQTSPTGNCDITGDYLWKPEGDGIRLILSADPAARGTPAQVTEFMNYRGFLETVLWVRVD